MRIINIIITIIIIVIIIITITIIIIIIIITIRIGAYFWCFKFLPRRISSTVPVYFTGVLKEILKQVWYYKQEAFMAKMGEFQSLESINVIYCENI